MKKIIINILAFLFFVITGFSQNEKSLLWEISGNGLTKSSYIFGTFHLLCPNDIVMSDATKNAIKSCEQMYLELDLDDPKIMAEIQQKMMLPKDQSMKDFLNEDDYKIINEYLKNKMGVGMSAFDKMKPFTLLSILMITYLPCQAQGYDFILSKMAKEENKEVFGLETLDFQIGVFEKIPTKDISSMLADMVKRKDVAEKEFSELVDNYKKQDIEKLLELTLSSEWNFKGFEEEFLNKRNTNWVPIIEDITKQKSTFIAVGAGHLGGKNGILQLLRDAGYTVKPLL